MLSKILNRARAVRTRFTGNFIRTWASRYEVFFPVSSMRWAKAQRAESASWHIPDHLEGPEISEFFHNEQTKARFLIKVAEQALGISVQQLMGDRTVLDIACGPGSIVSEMPEPSRKIGLDPAPFPKWVHERYSSLNFELISNPLESAIFHNRNIGPDPLVVMYNALQHFQDCEKAFFNLKNSLGSHQVFFVDYAYVPADPAHPQILTFSRIERMLRKVGYTTENLAVTYARLPGLVEMGNGEPARVISGIARI